MVSDSALKNPVWIHLQMRYIPVQNRGKFSGLEALSQAIQSNHDLLMKVRHKKIAVFIRKKKKKKNCE